MALPNNVLPQLFWVVLFGFQLAHSAESDSETVQRADGKETLVICENAHDDIHCPHGTITIKDAYYGRTDAHTCPNDQTSNKNCKATNCLDIVRDWCENKDKCHLEASNNLFGDPCPNTYKYLKVDYTCSKGFHNTGSDHHTHKELLCESQSKKITCPEGRTIKFKNASYGRMDKNTCPSENIKTTNCRAENTLSIVNNRCENKKECHLEATNNWFSDPCVGTYKYLSVEYQCVKGFHNTGSDHHTHKELLCESQSKEITCPEGRTIKFKNASYGRMDKNTCPSENIKTTNCRAENTLSIVNNRCENKKECHLEATNNWFSDPCVGTYKYLSVEYQCVKDQIYNSHTVTLCENETQKIACPGGSTLIIEDAFYGRTDKSICPQEKCQDTHCIAGNAFQVVNRRCKHKTECDLQSINSWFGDPCQGTLKYLQVKYKCV